MRNPSTALAFLLLIFALPLSALPAQAATEGPPRFVDGLAVVTEASTLDRFVSAAPGEFITLDLVLLDIAAEGVRSLQFGLSSDPSLEIVNVQFEPGVSIPLEVAPREYVIAFDACRFSNGEPLKVATLLVRIASGGASDAHVGVTTLDQYGEGLRAVPCGDPSFLRMVTDAGGTIVNPSGPRIAFLASERAVVVEGEGVVIGWAVHGAESVTLDGQAVPAQASERVSPVGLQSFDLVATASDGSSVSKTLEVEAVRLPRVDRFDVEIDTDRIPAVALYSWEVVGANSVEFTAAPGIHSPIGIASVAYDPSATWELIASNSFGTTRADAPTPALDGAAPAVLEWIANPAAINAPESVVTLSWNVLNATSVRIEPGVGDVDPTSGSIDVVVSQESEFTLTATNANGASTGAVTVHATGPSIHQFHAIPNPILRGETTTLHWRVSQAETIRIEPLGFETDDLEGTLEVEPSHSTTYTLFASNDIGSSDRSFTITVDAPTLETRWYVSGRGPFPGDSISLRWETNTNVPLTLDPGGIVIPAGIHYATVTPTEQSTVYTLTGTIGSNVFSGSFEPIEWQPPYLLAWDTPGNPIFPGAGFNVRLRSEGADSLRMDPTPGELEVVEYQIVRLTAFETTTWTATATNQVGATTQSFTVEVQATVPTVTLSADPSSPFANEPFTLHATVAGADSAVLQPRGIRLANGSHTLVDSVIASTQYTLTAYNAEGSASKSVTVTPRPPVIVEFEAPERALFGSTISLDIEVAGADRVFLEPGFGEIAPVSTVTTTLDSTTTYRLRAESPAGTTVAERTVVADVIRIVSFSAEPQSVPTGGTTRLTWEVEGEGRVQIEGNGDHPLVGSIDVTVEHSGIFRLNAFTPQGSLAESREIPINVYDPDATRILWSWSPFAVDQLPRSPQFIFSVYLVVEGPAGGIDAFEVSADLDELSPQFLPVQSRIVPTGEIVPGTDWNVALDSCLRRPDVQPLVELTLLAPTFTTSPPYGRLDLRAHPEPTVPGAVTYLTCAGTRETLSIGAPLDLDSPWGDVPVAVFDVDLFAEHTADGVDLSWTWDRSGCSDEVIVMRRDSSGGFEAIATLRGDEGCYGWTDASTSQGSRSYRVALHDGENYAISREVTIDVPTPEVVDIARSRLVGAFPNPFNPSTEIRFELARAASARIEIFDVSGRSLRTIDLGRRSAGPGHVTWHGRDAAGQAVSSGVYLVRLVADGIVDTRRVILVK